MPYFSIITPCYNKENYIAETIQSVLEQDFKDFELVIVDDGSSDKSVEIINSFTDSRIKLYKKANGGVSSARNFGIEHSNGQYIAFLDADDLWLTSHLSSAYKLIEKNSGYGLYCMKYARLKENKIFEANFKDIPNENNKTYVINDFFKKCASADNVAWTSAVVVPKKIFDNCVKFPDGINRGEDRFVWSVIALDHQVVLVNKITSLYRLHDAGLTSSKSFNFNWIFEDYYKSLDSKEIKYRPIRDVNMYIKSRNLSSFRFLINDKKYKNAFELIFSSLVYRELHGRIIYNISQTLKWRIKEWII